MGTPQNKNKEFVCLCRECKSTPSLQIKVIRYDHLTMMPYTPTASLGHCRVALPSNKRQKGLEDLNCQQSLKVVYIKIAQLWWPKAIDCSPLCVPSKPIRLEYDVNTFLWDTAPCSIHNCVGPLHCSRLLFTQWA